MTDYREIDPTVVGTLLSFEDVFSPQLNNTRSMLIHLPEGYATSDERYPVLYMHDGQNLFSRLTSFADDWAVDETLLALGQRRKPVIVVGIPNMGLERLDEYSPFENALGHGGRGDDYLAFIAETLKPQVDATFRTKPEREHTGLLGSSMGGLISLYGVFRRPETFGFCGALSPALWFAERAIFRFVESSPAPLARIYLDVGDAEGEHTLHDAYRMQGLLASKGYRVGRDLLYLEAPGGEHSEREWGTRLYPALRFLLR